MQLIDTHSHLYSPKFDADMEAIVERAQAVLSHVFLPNIDLNSIPQMKALHQRAPEFFFPMLGLHPCYVKDDFEAVLAKLEKEWENNAELYQGVGETGLDLYWDKSHFAQQQASLRVHCRWAREMDLPLILHGRDATPELIQLIGEEQDGRLKGIFHCFTGSPEEAAQIKDLGFLVGIGGVLTYKKSSLDATCREISLDQIVLETDSPYLPPTPHRGKRNESSYLPLIARKLADVKEVPVGEVARITSENALRLFGMLTTA